MTATILFDLDGTLVDSAPDLWAALNVALTGGGYDAVPFERVGQLVGQGALVMLKRGLAEQGISVSDTDLNALHARFLEHYDAHIADASTLFDGVEAALDQLQAQGHTLAVCTNKSEALSVKLLQALNLADRFKAICGPDTFNVKKPDPEHILKTIAHVGGTPGRAVMIGDSIADVNAAKAAHVPVIGVTYGYTDTPIADLNPDRVITAYDQLDAGIKALLGEQLA